MNEENIRFGKKYGMTTLDPSTVFFLESSMGAIKFDVQIDSCEAVVSSGFSKNDSCDMDPQAATKSKIGCRRKEMCGYSYLVVQCKKKPVVF